METRICQNKGKSKYCQGDFEITPDDFAFYDKIKVPPPTFCPTCRRQRRMAWRNDFVFYNRTCDATGKNIVSLYHQNQDLVVYDTKYWYSDAWDPYLYGKDFDFSRTFFEQFKELQKVVPRPALMNDDGIGSVNCLYTQNEAYAKNCYMVSMAWKNENCMYSYGISGPNAVDIVDSMDIFQCEKIYQSIFLNKSYDCTFCYYSHALVSSHFILDCRNLNNSFMCVGMRDGEYCFKNKKYSKEEYKEIISSYALHTFTGQQRAILEFDDFIKTHIERKPYIINCDNCLGDGILNSKNARYVFTARRCHNVKYFENGNDIVDGYDMLVGGENELCYEGITPDNDRKALFSIFSYKNTDVTYVEYCFSSMELFGCVGIRHGEYVIFNKKYSKEDYFLLKNKIIEHMKRTGEYGEFFPIENSYFGYNETIAAYDYPISQDEALLLGYNWQDNIQKTTGKETIDSIEDSIHEVGNSILSEILKCENCFRNYNIHEDELVFYRKNNIPIPLKCFWCRHTDRIKRRQKRIFY